MKGKQSTILAAGAIIVLCAAPFVNMLYEKERIEALFGGLLRGSIVGCILGVAALLLNKDKSKMVVVMSLIPICLLLLFLILTIPYYFYG